jgi:hypothetical protein
MEKNKLPIYKLTIDNNDTDCGVLSVALVDDPAIERNFMAFAKDKPMKFAIANADQRILSGPLMIPDMPIYRSDHSVGDLPEHYVIFDAATIKQAAIKFFKEQRNSSVNLMHNPDATVPDCFFFESILIDKERGIQSPKGFDLPEGSWFGSCKVNNQVLWDEFIKTGEFKGFSVEGFFKYNFSKEPDLDQMFSEIIDILEELSEE